MKKECKDIGSRVKNDIPCCVNEFYNYPICYDGSTNSELGKNVKNVVYLWTQKVEVGEVASYVGYTTDFIHTRCRNHKKPSGQVIFFKRRLRKHLKNFVCRIIDTESEISKLKGLEIFYIKKFKTFHDTNPAFGCNMTEGGEGHRLSMKIRKQISIALTGRKLNLSDEQRRYKSEIMKGDKNPFYGKTHTDKHKEDQRKRMSGTTRPVKTKKVMGVSQDIRWNKPDRGISLHRSSGKYIVFGKRTGEKRKYLGLYKTIEEARISIKNYNNIITV